MKKLGKAFVLAVLSWQLKRLNKRNPTLKKVGVVGSYGKTSTKLALATVLGAGLRVQYQDGNYNDIVTVPLIFFGEELPSLLNPFAWTALFVRNESKLRKQYPYDAVVLEFGTDTPGNVSAFARYLTLDVAVVTSIAYEHMEFFADIDAVAHEELAVQAYADELLVNADLCDATYLADISKPLVRYATDQEADYRAVDAIEQGDRLKFTIRKGGQALVHADCENSARAVQYSALVGAAVGEKFGLTPVQIEKGIANITPAAGRMRRLQGINDITILDDTYNASPEAVKASLDTLYASPIGPKFALLGNMNELGSFSPDAHTDVGLHCDPSQLDTVLTLGTDANTYTAESARQNGCKVVEFTSPYAAGKWLADNVPAGAIVLAKGSQNGVFAEEAVKLLLKDSADASKLVRQSPAWLKQKRRQFSDSSSV